DIVPLMSRDMTFLITRRLKPGPSFLLYTNPDPSFQANHLPTTSALPARYSRLNRAPTESFLLNNSCKMLEFGSRCFSQGARRASADRHIKRGNIELQLEIWQACGILMPLSRQQFHYIRYWRTAIGVQAFLRVISGVSQVSKIVVDFGLVFEN